MVKYNDLKDVRILLIGDSGVGKTSLIFALVSEEFPEEVPAKAEEITIPPDVTPERVNTQIVDFSTKEQDNDDLNREILKANVICIVYSVDNDDSINRISSYWLPFIQDKLGKQTKPVVLVGNKADLVRYSSLDSILPIMNQYSEIETCVECSAKTLKNISELFYYAQKAVLHPTSPLYSAENRDLTYKCQKALSRIFKICDDDNDGILNDHELNTFQRRCFNSPLQAQALIDVKNILKRSVTGGIKDDGITLTGFLFLHCLFIQRGRHETTWTVLRKFGYNEKVELDKDYINPPLDVPIGCTTELTNAGIQFLTKLFFKYDTDKDSILSDNEITNLFSICPNIPNYFLPQFYLRSVQTIKSGLDLHSYLCLWILMTYVEVNKVMELLAYLGYIDHPDESQFSAILVTRDKRLDLQKRQTSRNVFCCHVVGPQEAGKTSFMRGFLDKAEIENNIPTKKTDMSNYAINTVKIYGQDKYLIIREIDLFSVTDKLQEPELLCDVICLMYACDDPKSFEYIGRIFLKHFSECKLPIMVVSSKSDLSCVLQNYILQPSEFCKKHKLTVPMSYSIYDSRKTKLEVYIKLGTMAAYPNLRNLVHVLLMRPSSSWFSQRLSSFRDAFSSSDTSAYVRASLGIATLTVVGFFVLRFLRAVNEHSNPR